ncbi:FtsX-like permease family protein [Lacticaseibacillus porcinae]|uniref:FtsX-like permease family protein n=1 Tax=Lacticaseibacillus porcinae TaxID=1123687 RepID=UPI000F7814FF|nr:FtsX-like permease family protein [Lacticaseibacillus porcinae]
MKPMTKNLWREIRASKGRFIAIILIIFMGCLIFVGVRAAGPGLNESLTTTVQKAKLSDVQLMSTTGFTKKDVNAVETVSGAQAEATKFTYVTGGRNALAVALYGYDRQASLNQLTLRAGHLPRSKTQVVLDYRAKSEYNYKLGQTFTFGKTSALKHRTFTIVGFADSPQYIDNGLRGAANVGDGTVRFFAYVPQSQMTIPASLLSVRFKAIQGHNTYADSYQTARDKKLRQLKTIFKKRALTRSNDLYQEALAKIAPQEAKLTAANQQLKLAQAQVAQASGGQMTTTPAIDQQLATLKVAQAKLEAAKTKAKQQTKTTYTYQDRSDLPGFSAYGESSERIAAIANVFPVFFFLIAALITFTTITRMVEEARGQIGTFKALGYGKWAIAKNYLEYALIAALVGGVLGSIFGNETLPRFILALYGQTIPMIATVRMQWGSLGLALGFSLIATVGAAAFVVRRELQEGPAALMLPKAPKSAKRILLERITPLWSRLNFNQKVSYRNLFRYKSRMVMSIIGIAGGCALILTGFGIRDSIIASGTRQYGDIVKYQAVVSLKGSAQKAQSVLADDANYRSSTKVMANTAKVRFGDESVASVNVFTPKTGDFSRYIHLSTPKGQAITLPKQGAVISQKTATLLGVKVGDRVSVTVTGDQRVSLKIAAITKNYIGDYLYLSADAYQKAWHQAATSNALLVRLAPQSDHQRNTLAHRLLKSGTVLGTSFVADQKTTIDNMSSTLNPVVMIFIVMSGLLSFVVMYNLTNINVSERIRELSTVKVLGFYDREVTMYVSRENIVLTLIGIIFGYGVGNALTWYILRQATTAQVMFPLTIHWPGYVAAAVLMAVFTGVVILVTHRRLQHVDMVSALKATE